MRKLILIMIVLFFTKCVTYKNVEKTNKEIDILKKYAYCLFYSKLEKSCKTDNSMEEVILTFDYNGMYSKNIDTIFNKFITSKVNELTLFDSSDKLKHYESSNSKNFSIIQAINFYNSKSLDSLVKKIPKKVYRVE